MVIGLILDDGVVKAPPPIARALLELSAVLRAHGHEVVVWDTFDHAECIEIMDIFYTVDGGEDIRRDVAVYSSC
jgi:amidase